jgi:acyl carrier protein
VDDSEGLAYGEYIVLDQLQVREDEILEDASFQEDLGAD